MRVHPNSSDEILKDFAAEVDDLQLNGVRVGSELTLKKVSLQSMDAMSVLRKVST